MEILNPIETTCFDDEDLLNFTLEGEENDSRDSLSSSFGSKTTAFSHEMNSSTFSDIVEEELEWLSNKDAFPTLETCFGILSDNPQLVSDHLSPISVLENTTNTNGSISTSTPGCFVSLKLPMKFPVRARTKRQRRRRRDITFELPTQQCRLSITNRVIKVKNGQADRSSLFLVSSPVLAADTGSSMIGRRCLHCQVDKTPQWRAGPMGPKTLCNACGVRYKSGRLLPEYRPANSPTFSSALHSNSHRKVVEMRKQKQMANEDCGYIF